MSDTAKVMWRAFGRVWNGELTGNVSPDGYSEVKPAVGSEDWIGIGGGIGWVLTSIIERPVHVMPSA